MKAKNQVSEEGIQVFKTLTPSQSQEFSCVSLSLDEAGKSPVII